MNIAIINQSGGKYLFEVPDSITLKEGEKVKCDTRRGITDGIVWADSITADEPAAKLIGKLLGAKFPLKSVVGKSVTSVEMFEQPKQEPVKLYCVEDYSGFTTKGKVYEFTDGDIRLDDGYRRSGWFTDYADFVSHNGGIVPCLVPLVKRPAKVGEWVLVTSDCVDGTHENEVCQVLSLNEYGGNKPYLRTKKPTTYGHPGITPCTLAAHNQYLVLDGYKPEPEKAEPERLNMRVVCVEATDRDVTLGKVYTVESGVFTWNSGKKSDTKATTIEQFNNWFIAAKFIEFKGE